jgi:quercetin dioxygenase-like cupin family protein
MTAPRPYSDFTADEVHDEGAHGATIRWVIGEEEGSRNDALRVIELAPHGHTPYHNHWFEHQNYVIQGEGTVTIGDQTYAIAAGDVIFVPGDVQHQYRNTGDGPLTFLCGIPQPWIREARKRE